MKSVLVIAYRFPPQAAAGVHRTIRFVKYLTRIGWNISVLTAAPEYFSPNTRVDSDLLKKVPDNVEVYRTKVLRGISCLISFRNRLLKHSNAKSVIETSSKNDNDQSNRKSFLQYIKDVLTSFFTVPDGEVGWLPYATVAGTVLLRSEEFDVLYSSGPPWTCHLIAYCLKRTSGKAWVADFRDPWARAPWKLKGKNKGFLRRKVQAILESCVIRSANAVILNTQTSRDDFKNHYSSQVAEKFHVITNGFDPEDFKGLYISRDSNLRFAFTHTGALYGDRNPENFLRALASLFGEGKLERNSLGVNLVGVDNHGPNDIVTLIQQLGLQDVVNLIPPVPHRKSLEFLARSDVLLLIQPGTALSVPGKLFEYIAVGKPILALTGEGATLNMIREDTLGFIADIEDIAKIKDIVLTMYHSYRGKRQNCAKLRQASEKYSGAVLTRSLDNILTKLCGQCSG